MKILWIFILAVLVPIPAFAVQDIDGDGISDRNDKCNDLKEDYLGKDRFDGCPNTEQKIITPEIETELSSSEPITVTTPIEPITDQLEIIADSQKSTEQESAKLNLQDVEIQSLSNMLSFDYFNNLVTDITEQASFYDLIIFSISVVIYAIFIFHFYRFIARRNIFSFDVERRILGGKYKSSGEKISAAPRIAAFIGTKFVIFPFVIFGWFLAYSFFILFMSQDIQAEKVFFVSAILIIAIRITSYYNEDLSKDLAKTIPFSILGIFMFDQTFFTIDDISKNLLELPQYALQVGAFLILAITIEIALSIAYLLRLKLSGTKRKTNSNSEQPITSSQ